MARKTKKGLGYFPLDVDFFDDDKIELINAEFGVKGENIALRLLCLIYRNGYWYKLTEDETLLLAKRVGNGITGALVGEVVKGLVKRSFFNEGVFNSFQILTSRGIQQRFFEAVERRKEIEIVPEIMLIDINDYINEDKVSINHLNVDSGTQSKEKKSKVKESKEVNISFDFFWTLYDKKKGDLKQVEKKWNGLTDEERQRSIDHIPKYKIEQPDKKFRKDPATYLNNKSFNDEIITNANNTGTYQKSTTGKLETVNNGGGFGKL